ncbi:MAG: hypothetical protein IPL98_17695 [Saprospiraceae bacterium]|jgi:hypothetical protein|nr:hypothetical protein [Saprospiraceae bacterium]
MIKISRRKIDERRDPKAAAMQVKKAAKTEAKKAVTNIVKRKKKVDDSNDAKLDPRKNDPETTLSKTNNGSEDPVLES